MQRAVKYERIMSYIVEQVWISFAKFELGCGSDDALEKSRNIYKEANEMLKQNDEKEQRLLILEAWLNFEVRNWN